MFGWHKHNDGRLKYYDENGKQLFVASKSNVFSDYEQRLWDGVAQDALRAMLASDHDYTVGSDKTHFAEDDHEFAIVAFDFADAFMAEREKRMKGK